MSEEQSTKRYESRRRRLKVRLGDDELRALEERARGAGMTKSDYLRRRLAECAGDRRGRRPPRPRVLPAEVREALLPLARVGNNLNQLARWENARRSPADAVQVLGALRELSSELAEIRQMVLKAPVAAGAISDDVDEAVE